MNNDFITRLAKSLDVAKLNAAQTELEVRCPYCGDSRKHSNKGHLYITTNAPYLFRCVKCETSGRVNDKFLHDLGCYDNDVLLEVLRANREERQQNRDKTVKIEPKKKNITLPIVDSAQSRACLAYFNNRYKTNYDLDTIVNRFKVVCDIDAFVTENKLYFECKYFNLRNAIGFLSADKTYVIFRDITGMQNIRYYNLQLVDNEIPHSKRYTISSPIDIMKDQITLVMTEGIFDIIGVYNKFYKDYDKNDVIFCATCGKSYTTAIMQYIKQGFLNLNIIIYSDADVDYKWYIDKVKNSNKIMQLLNNSKITIYYNTLDKDFGVPEDNISLRKVLI